MGIAVFLIMDFFSIRLINATTPFLWLLKRKGSLLAFFSSTQGTRIVCGICFAALVYLASGGLSV